MKPIDQRIALAKLQGWTALTESVPGILLGSKLGHDGIVPNYLEDLNAMHELLMRTSLYSPRKYLSMLNDIVLHDESLMHNHKMIEDLMFYEPTAAQKAEALLKVMGLWVDAQPCDEYPCDAQPQRVYDKDAKPWDA